MGHTAQPRRRILIMGAAGRDFHNFNTLYRDDPAADVVAFTAAQIPGIGGRRYPAELAGSLYPEGVPIHDEAELEAVCRERAVDQVDFAYSDVPQRGGDARGGAVPGRRMRFSPAWPREATQLRSTRPVVAICAVRSGALRRRRGAPEEHVPARTGDAGAHRHSPGAGVPGDAAGRRPSSVRWRPGRERRRGEARTTLTVTAACLFVDGFPRRRPPLRLACFVT